MVDYYTALAIVLMALSTYMTRILGFLVLRNRNLDKRTIAVLDAVPGCVLISVIAPAFVSHRISDLLALTITLAAATRLSLLPTVLVGISGAALFRSVF